MIHRNRRIAMGTLVAMLGVLAGCGSDKNTEPTPDTTAPTVISTNPLDGATGVAVITVSFSEAMAPATLSTSTFTLSGPGPSSVAGTVTYNSATHIARFSPGSALSPATAYHATVTTGAKDVAGNHLAANHAWNFTTSALTGGQPAPSLGTAAAFVILADSAVSNVGATSLGGDLGLSPGVAITGFPPGVLTGAIHAGDATAATAMADRGAAYADVAGRSTAAVTVAGDLGGLTLPPGLYKSTSSLEISSNDLTLDAQGNADAIFLFQAATTLTTASNRSVILIGGAKASNVFWQVGTAARLGTSSHFKGTILADDSISLFTGATLEGRALARTGEITLSANSVVLP